MSDLTPFLSFAQGLAAEAGGLITGYFRRTSARRKSDGTLVTDADERANDLIVNAIQTAWPGHAILSEEGDTTYDPTVEYTWVIDPLDGTTNFARGFPIWGVSIALLRAGTPLVAVVDFPLLREVYRATAGGGAFCNDEALETDQAAGIDNQHIFTQCTRTRRRLRIQSPLKARMLGSAAYHLLAMARGSSLVAACRSGSTAAAAEGPIFPSAQAARWATAGSTSSPSRPIRTGTAAAAPSPSRPRSVTAQ